MPAYKTRRFPIDDDFLPRNPAPGNGPDMIFEFENYFLIVEVTMTTSLRQLVAEGEPVRRHVVDIKLKTQKDVYCLFIAPEVDNNTIETFRIGVWYRGDEVDYVNIVPFSLVQYRKLIEGLKVRRYSPIEFRQLLDKCLAYRNVRAPEWKRIIETEATRWITALDN